MMFTRERLTQFHDFGDGKQPHPVLCALLHRGEADGVVETLTQDLEHLWQHEVGTDEGEEAETRVPDCEAVAKFEWHLVAHLPANRKDQQDVNEGGINAPVPVALHPFESGQWLPVQDAEVSDDIGRVDRLGVRGHGMPDRLLP